jgi:hypothetical protein
MHTPARRNLAWSTIAAAAVALLGVTGGFGGCAKVNTHPGSTGSGGGGGSGQPQIPGLVSIKVMPDTQTVDMTLDANNKFAPASVSYTATGTFEDGSSKDITSMVNWPSNFGTLNVAQGHATVTAPGTYTITAKSGGVTGTAMLVARFQGSFNDGSIPGGAKTSLDGNPAGAATIAYPLDGALFPSNLGPIWVHVTKNSGATAARLEFKTDAIDIMYYGPCETDPVNLPGPGCYVQLPLSFTQLLIPASENGDISLTARVGGSGAPSESGSIKVAWSNVALSGGLYYWTVIDPLSVPGYTSPEVPPQPLGTGVQRYDFDAQGATAPELVWTDHGAPNAFTGSAQSWDGNTAGGHCVGCHAITPNDGKYMTLTLGGSSSVNGANFSLLDITAKSLAVINPTAKMDPNSSLTVNPTDYWKQFRRDGLATESTWSPNGDVLVSMYQSKLFLSTVTITPGVAGGALPTATVIRTGAALPTWGEYESDPFWSVNGDFLTFTTFTTPDTDPNNPTGLNGDMKRTGTIAIADATNTTITGNARYLLPHDANVTRFYPAISSDSKFIVFNESACGGGGVDSNKLATDYGNQTCDGYDDWTTTLSLTTPTGGSATRLDRANGNVPASNSWPRWSPDVGMFRGKTLYWIAFSSRRPYGLQVNNGSVPTLAKPQLWFAGLLTGGEFDGDPSFAPVWLPAQNPKQSSPNGNHVPQWVKVAVPIPP